MKRKSKRLLEAEKQLDLARGRQRQIRKEIDALRAAIRDAGGNPDIRKNDQTKRNKQIYRQWKDGQTFKEMGQEYKLSAQHISSICKRIDATLRRKGFHFKKYKDLLPYFDG